jgi:hypothetical protein
MTRLQIFTLVGALDLAAIVSPNFWASVSAPPKFTPVTAADLGMERYKINFPDERLWIFNGHVRCHASRWSTTGFFDLYPGYRFHFDFVEKRSDIRIIDNVNEIMNSQDPLGFNLRPHAPFCLVAQDDTWYPHVSVRTGTFHKKFPAGFTSFAIESRTLVSATEDKALMALTISNRSSKPLTLTLLPIQRGTNLFQLPWNGRFVCVSSDLSQTNGEGLVWTLPPQAAETHNFQFALFDSGKCPPVVNQSGLVAQVAQCEADGQEQIRRIASRLPAINTHSRQLDDFYKRCIASLALCRWNRADWRNQPTWVCGGFICIVGWDFSFAADTLSMVEPQALRTVVRDILGIGQLQGSYIDKAKPGTLYGILYTQDPFALQIMISRYIVITGDRSILDDRAGDATVYQWLKRWGDKLNNGFAKGPYGLIDVGESDDNNLIEIRTSDYNHVVPVVNGLAADYYHWLAKLATQRNDPDAAKFNHWGDALQNALREGLWDEPAGWFDNLYPDCSRKPIYSNHLLDLLGTSVITEHQRQALVAHIREGEFLADYGMYSISKLDTVHWDRMDADWGGGGSYVGTPLRIARRLYEQDNPQAAWDLLKRMARLADHFCFLPQSPFADEPNEFRTGGNLSISCASGMEAIWCGIFGLRPQADGTMLVKPAPYNAEIGEAELAGYRFRQHRYDVRLGTTNYEVYLDGKLFGRKHYGLALSIPAQVEPPPAAQ